MSAPNPYRPAWERFKQEAWVGLMEWGTLVIFGALALMQRKRMSFAVVDSKKTPTKSG